MPAGWSPAPGRTACASWPLTRGRSRRYADRLPVGSDCPAEGPSGSADGSDAPAAPATAAVPLAQVALGAPAVLPDPRSRDARPASTDRPAETLNTTTKPLWNGPVSKLGKN